MVYKGIVILCRNILQQERIYALFVFNVCLIALSLIVAYFCIQKTLKQKNVKTRQFDF